MYQRETRLTKVLIAKYKGPRGIITVLPLQNRREDAGEDTNLLFLLWFESWT